MPVAILSDTSSSMILALETATPICSVALKDNTGQQFEERIDSPGSHSEKLFLFIKKLMDTRQFEINDLSAILVSEGPGSYTGLRIAASGVKGLLFGSNVPLYRISTLASFATAAHQKEPDAPKFHAILDARRVHLYCQTFNFKGGMMHAECPVDIIPIEMFEKMVESDDVIVGTGLERFDGAVLDQARCYGKDLISACSLIQLYEFEDTGNFIKEVDPSDFDPNYFTARQEE
jgi:tRNA threonylcarbamoyl adenosine modification protein YeaZ